MDPSIMKLLEDDEDENMHSGADVEAFTAALNRDIGGDASAVSQPTGSDTGILSQRSNSPSKQFSEQGQNPSQEGNIAQQVQQNDQQQQSADPKLSSEVNGAQQDSGSKDINKKITNETGNDQQLTNQDQHHSDQQQEQPETSSPHVERDQNKKPEQNLGQSQEEDRAQSSESQHQLTTQELNNQQASSSNQANNSTNRGKLAPAIPFQALIPILRPNLDKDRNMQLQMVFARLRNNEIGKDDFLRVVRNIVGDEMLRQAAYKVQLQQLQAQAFQSSQKNPNRYSLPAQAASQSPSTQGQMQTDVGFQNIGSSNQKSQENENQQDDKEAHPGQASSGNGNVVNLEREIPTQSVNKQQQLPQPPQGSFSMYGGKSNPFHALPHPRSSMSAVNAILKSPTQDSQSRQSQSMQGTTRSGSIEPMNSIGPASAKYDKQDAGNENKRLHVGSSSQSTSSSSLQQISIASQSSGREEQRSGAFTSMAYVKQEVEQTSEQHKPQVTASDSSSFGSMSIDQGNQIFGSLKDGNMNKQSSRNSFSANNSMIAANQIAGPMTSQIDLQMQNHMSAATPPILPGTSTKTSTKKPSAGQKKTMETLGSPSPPASKKQKTSGAFHDQSIEQLNDVTAVSGVNLREEEEQLLSTLKEDSRASEATRRFVQEEEERLILQKGPLQKKLADIISRCDMQSTSNDVERCLSMCVEERLRGLIGTLVRLSKQRVDIEKTRHRFVITSDVHRQILAMNQKAKDEWEKKQADEAEKFRKLNETDGNTGPDAEKEKDESRSKAPKANKEEDDKMRTTAANVAARAAVGGDDMMSKWQLMAEQARQKREGLDSLSGSQAGKTAAQNPSPALGKALKEQQGEKKGPSAASLSGGIGKMGKSAVAAVHPKIARSICTKDVIAVLEREPQMSKSPLIYRLYERIPGDYMAE